MNDQALRLPRLVEADPRGEQLLADITRHQEPLWAESPISIPIAELGPHLATALRSANLAGQLARGFENVQKRLAAEARGLDMADERSEVPRGARVSRLLILSNDGSERFCRQVETLLARHGTRLLAIRLRADETRLGQELYGPSGRVRVLMIERKEAVARVLLALADQWAG